MSVDGDRCLAGVHLQAVLRDGTAVCLRAIRPDDKARLQVAFAHLSPRTVYQRFFHAVTELTGEDLRRSTEVDFRDHVCIVLTVGAGRDERLIAMGRYVRAVSGADSAEVAFTVLDEYQGRGAASLLLRKLVAIARVGGIRRLVALVLNDNRQMLEVFRHSKLPLHESFVDGVRRVVLTLDRAAPAEVCHRRPPYDLRDAERTQWRGFPYESPRKRGYARS